MRGMEMGMLRILWPWGFANQDLSCQKLSVYCLLYIAVRLKLQFMGIDIRSDNLVRSEIVLKYQQWVYMGILYTTKSNDGMVEDYSQRS